MSSILQDLIETKDITIQEILNNLLDGTNDLDLKTHINRPKELSVLYLIAEYLDTIGYEISSEILKIWIEKFERYMVSYKRLSRKEIIKALSGFIETDVESSSSMKRLTTNLK